jgi:hypothetical protein
MEAILQKSELTVGKLQMQVVGRLAFSVSEAPKARLN